ncbi:MAG TPA: S41 family peptidase [Flavobacteriaceae bacterium]|nr:S41 family peptidase [Flavobacteriaceae bacterium]
MKKYSLYLLSICLLLIFSSCFHEDFDDKIRDASLLNNQNFVYEGLKEFYLYKANKEVLADDYFSDTEDLNAYLQTFNSPESLFESLLFHEDRFSIIVPDFRVLEKQLAGISLRNGMAFGLAKITSTGKVFGYVRYVMPNTSAAQQGVERGMLFDKIDGIALTESNYQELLAPDHYTINLAKLQGENLIALNQTISLQKTEHQENPIHLQETLNIDGHKIGYLMYNAFTRSYNADLNAVFGDFKTAGITDLVLDLRYNGGGSIETSRALAGMITGQFTGQLFVKEVYNQNFADNNLLFKDQTPEGASLNSLTLNKVYILTSASTASASELLINGLNPYIEVVQIGDNTVGKFQGSTTLYDSHNFTRAAVQPGHNYAMQPLILKTINADGYTDYHNGLIPDLMQKENLADLGELGNPTETLLQIAIQSITGSSEFAKPEEAPPLFDYSQIGENKMDNLLYQQMHTDLKQE